MGAVLSALSRATVAAALVGSLTPTGRIVGVVQDEACRGMLGVKVRTLAGGVDRTELTNVRGEFRIEGLPPGKVAVRIEQLGWLGVREMITVHTGRTTQMSTTLYESFLSERPRDRPSALDPTPSEVSREIYAAVIRRNKPARGYVIEDVSVTPPPLLSRLQWPTDLSGAPDELRTAITASAHFSRVRLRPDAFPSDVSVVEPPARPCTPEFSGHRRTVVAPRFKFSRVFVTRDGRDALVVYLYDEWFGRDNGALAWLRRDGPAAPWRIEAEHRYVETISVH